MVVEWIVSNPGMTLLIGPIVVGLLWCGYLTLTGGWKEK